MNRCISNSLSASYHVISAFDGQQGLEMARASHPTLIVTEIMMPRVSGVQMISEVRECRELATIPILLLSARDDEELKIHLLSNGAQDFVTKPYSEHDLLVRVRNLIDWNSSLERHRTIFTLMDQGFCTIEVLFDEGQYPIDYRFLESNQAFEKQTGLKDAVGKRMRELSPQHEQHWFDIYGQIALTGVPARFEKPAAALNRCYDVHAFRVGKPEQRHVSIFFTDITNRKAGEAALRDKEHQLRALSDRSEPGVPQRTEEVGQSQARFRALATELNLAEQIERKRVTGELYDHLQQLLVLGKLKLGQGIRHKTLRACSQVMTETDEVLTEALQSTRTLASELYPPLLLEQGLSAGLRWLGEYMRQHNLIVTVECLSDELRLPEDHEMLLFHSVRELLINSAKRAQPGLATVRMSRVNIEVYDQGFGSLAPASSQTPTPLFSNLGHFSIRERMETLGGQLEVQSALRGGSTVVLKLPVVDCPTRLHSPRPSAPLASRPVIVPEPLLPPGAVPSQSPGRTRVLLVDDHAIMRQALRSVLVPHSDLQIVCEAQDGEEAIALVHQLRPSLVIMDINMPLLDGVEATAQIKSWYPNIKVLGVSVNTGRENQERMLQAGAVRLIRKEMVVEELYRVIQEVMIIDG